ncbi:prostaglandin reductase 1-like [Anoplophora glabripennis]|uniref:prostaglandin reductase 1-like n=1 Tax=Anoplophora glabripennis TaxID=217634 RepID=UPI00087451C2|nr:prostaglandin reductase 1-like [Anoplophora glabripennis]
MMVKAKVFIYNKEFDGLPKEGDLIIKEEDLPPLKDGEYLAEAVYLSVDPYMRAYAPSIPLGSVYIGSQIAKILESKNSDYPVGRYVVGYFGWRSHTVHDGRTPEAPANFPAPFLIPDLGDVPLSYFLSILGMPGNTAYFGFLEICQPKKGETVVVSGAAGAVGNIVGQIAKIKGCKVIGIAGSEEKGKWLVDELGFDHFINYKTDDLDETLSQVAPKGVDCYFDNVGGETTATVIQHMNEYGRISLCGSVSSYNKKDRSVRIPLFLLVAKQIKAEGFLFYRWVDRSLEGVQQNLKWLQEGKLKYRETVTEGFGNTFKAFVEMLEGKNVGKAVVKV